MPPDRLDRVKVIREDVEDGEILTRVELEAVRKLLALMRRKDIDYERLERLLDDEPNLHEIADGKKAAAILWRTSGALAKWVALIIGGILAVKGLIGLGRSP